MRLLTFNIRLAAAIIACVLVLGLLAYLVHRSPSRFAASYTAYSVLAQKQQDAAFVPGAPNNPVRQQLSQFLTQILAKQTSAKERLKLATQGLSSLGDSEKQINEIGTTGEKVDSAIAKMQVDSLGDISSSDISRQIVALAKQRSSIISDIRGYSYRADFEIDKIFRRIIADGGKLTDAYVIELNDEVPAVEAQFNKRSDLYNQLQAVSGQIEEKSSQL